MGRVLRSCFGNENEMLQSLNEELSTIESGVYLLECRGEHEFSTVKLIKD